MRITTDGGYTWRRQFLPKGGYLSNSYGLFNFTNINKDTIWGSGGVINYPGNSKGFLYRTTNGGNNWYYQVPDTSYGMRYYEFINFINSNNGWSYTQIINRGIHTVSGGDSLFYTKINQEMSQILKYFILYQNFPNPFNPKTIISFELNKTGNVKLSVFDIQGKNIAILVNVKKQSGKYEVEFDGHNYSSGIYLYKLEISGKEIYSDTKRMILLK